MPPRQRLVEAARVLTPHRQGDLDALCGLYAIINAVRLALYPRQLRKAEQIALFARGLAEIERRHLLREIMLEGSSNRPWLRLCRTVVEAAAAITGEALVVVQPKPRSIRTTAQAISAIEQHLRRGRPVLLELQGRLDHWTVVIGMSGARLTFFDSSDHRWIMLGAVELVRGRAAPTHGIFATGIVALRRMSPRRATNALALP